MKTLSGLLARMFFVGLVVFGLVPPAVSEQRRPPVCSNKALVDAIRIIDSACNELTCDFASLRKLNQGVEKGALLKAFKEPDLQSVHIFFPMNVSDVHRSFDWTIKRAQLASLKYINDPSRSIIYVLGRASAIGDFDANERLSRERMRSVMRFLKDELGVKCYGFHGGWFGEEIQQLGISDAGFLRIEHQDFRSSEEILNQSVHIFVFPCAEMVM